MQYSSDPHIRKIEKARYKEKQLSLIAEGKKWCEKCQEIHPIEAFTKNSFISLGFNPMCKKCYHVHYYYPNKQRHLDNAKKWKQENPERAKELAKIHREKRKADPSERMIKNLASIINTYSMQLPNTELMPQDYFGCLYEELKSYIQSLWEPGMTWENYGHGKDKWQVDHIIPIQAFDFTKKGHMEWCCNFHNLRPLWHQENQNKRDKLPNGMTTKAFRRSVLEHEYHVYLSKLLETQQGVSTKVFMDSYGDAPKVIYVYI